MWSSTNLSPKLFLLFFINPWLLLLQWLVSNLGFVAFDLVCSTFCAVQHMMSMDFVGKVVVHRPWVSHVNILLVFTNHRVSSLQVHFDGMGCPWYIWCPSVCDLFWYHVTRFSFSSTSSFVSVWILFGTYFPGCSLSEVFWSWVSSLAVPTRRLGHKSLM